MNQDIIAAFVQRALALAAAPSTDGAIDLSVDVCCARWGEAHREAEARALRADIRKRGVGLAVNSAIQSVALLVSEESAEHAALQRAAKSVLTRADHAALRRMGRD